MSWRMGLVLVCMLQSVPAWGETVSLALEPAAQHIGLDSSGKVRVAVNTEIMLHAYSIKIKYDPLILHYQSFRGLQFFGSSSFLFKQIDSANGLIQVDEALLGPGGRIGSGGFFEVTFVGTTNGTTLLQFDETDLRDSTSTALPVVTQNAEIQVGNANGVEETAVAKSNNIQLMSYPNPFNLSTTIVIKGELRTPTIMQIFSVLGQEVFSKAIASGYGDGRAIMWDARDRSGKIVPSGMYFVRVEANASIYWRRIVLVK